jgi:hypothetical protein
MKASEQNFLCNFKGNPTVECHCHQLPSINICGSTDVPLSIIIKFAIVACHFVSTGCTGSSLEYSVGKILYTNGSSLTNETYSDKPPVVTEGRRWGSYLGSGV